MATYDVFELVDLTILTLKMKTGMPLKVNNIIKYINHFLNTVHLPIKSRPLKEFHH